MKGFLLVLNSENNVLDLLMFIIVVCFDLLESIVWGRYEREVKSFISCFEIYFIKLIRKFFNFDVFVKG